MVPNHLPEFRRMKMILHSTSSASRPRDQGIVRMRASCEGRGHNPHRQLSGVLQEWPWGRYFDEFWEAEICLLRSIVGHYFQPSLLFLEEFQGAWPYCPFVTFSSKEQGPSEERPGRDTLRPASVVGIPIGFVRDAADSNAEQGL